MKLRLILIDDDGDEYALTADNVPEFSLDLDDLYAEPEDDWLLGPGKPIVASNPLHKVRLTFKAELHPRPADGMVYLRKGPKP
jgi:hypothetical protein